MPFCHHIMEKIAFGVQLLINYLKLSLLIDMEYLNDVKIRGWKGWEQETSTHDYEFSNGISLCTLCFIFH